MALIPYPFALYSPSCRVEVFSETDIEFSAYQGGVHVAWATILPAYPRSSRHLATRLDRYSGGCMSYVLKISAYTISGYDVGKGAPRAVPYPYATGA
jgi:hypothetical protein